VDNPRPRSPGAQAQPRDVQALGRQSQAVAEVRPLDVSVVRTVTVGTVLFLVAGLVLVLFFREWMEDTDREWWLWTCVAGFGLGIFGYDHCRRRARHLAGDGS
jgi:Protein of unknown function (DUF2530)